MNEPRFTPTEQRILDLLSDGKPHTPKELHSCLWDEQARVTAIWHHIFNIRGKVRDRGEDIVCELYRHKIHYRHVLLLTSRDTQSA